ncbi:MULTISPECIES: glycosyl hydrolase-related protein [unclassified Streptomyces]|uniref:glycosyl hydrolase-related protein n=1 Tax=unclassified Streptomyces TaxID=2593676 RepID=UPI003369E6C3
MLAGRRGALPHDELWRGGLHGAGRGALGHHTEQFGGRERAEREGVAGERGEGGARHGGEDGVVVVRLSLLRGSRFPDPDADVGRHRFRWALLPGADVPAAVEAASVFNAPDLAALPPLEPLVAMEPLTGHAVVDWVKLADDGSGDLVVRIYETQGGRARALLRPCADLGADAVVWETDLLERELGAGDGTDDETASELSTALPRTSAGTRRPADGAALDLGPFQVATLRIAP